MSALDRLAERVLLLWGWRRAVLALALGGLSALAHAPFHLFPILFLTLPPLVWMTDGALVAHPGLLRRLAPAFALGWWFGLGYFLAGLYWVGAAFLVDADIFGWMMPLAVVALPAGLALFYGLGFAIARLLWSEGPARIAALAVGIAISDWLRGHILTGFPWNPLGAALAANDVLLQSASVFGVYGLTLIAVLIFASPALLVPGPRRWPVPVLSVALLAALAGFGVWRLAEPDPGLVPGPRFRLVQPNVPQDFKWEPEVRAEIFRSLLSLSAGRAEGGGLQGVTHVVWPESATPFLLSREPEALAAIGAMLPDGAVLVTGSNRVDETAEPPAVYNSVYAVDDSGRIVGLYDKLRLVPFGEYLPLAEWLEPLGLRHVVAMPSGFAAGRRAELMRVGAAPPFRPLICYEIIFSGGVVDAGERPAFLLNVTNDAWFGDSAGPRQHLHLARLRAVEEGLPVLRAANTGISAVIDARGRVRDSLPLGAQGVIDAPLPGALPPTIFARHGGALFWALVLSLAVVALAGRVAPRVVARRRILS